MEILKESRDGIVIDSESEEGCTLSDVEGVLEAEDVSEVPVRTTKRKRGCQAAYNMDKKESVPAYLDGTLPDDLVELFSPPRLAPVARGRGLRAELSIDIKCGEDLYQPEFRRMLFMELERRRPKVVMDSAPCTFYSPLNRLFNLHKFSPAKMALMQDEAESLNNLGFIVGKYQLQCRRGYAKEHPLAATSWQLNGAMHLANDNDFQQVVFDQCQVGLVSKVHRIPQQKKTKFLTNIRPLVHCFHDKKCECEIRMLPNGKHGRHQEIIGSEGGMKRSEWAQHYPPAMVSLMVDALEMYCR